VLTRGSPNELPRRWWVGASCAFAVLLAAMATYVFVTPIGEQSDELAHLNYAQLIAHHLALPTEGIQERQQPPLYYALVAGVLKVTGDNLRAARWVSVSLVLITALLLVATLRLLLPGRPWVALAGLWAFALLPSVQYEGAQVSNDAIAWVAGAFTLFVLVVVLRTAQPSLAQWALVGIAVGLALMAKATVWSLAVLLVVAILVHHRRRIGVSQVAAAVIPAVAISGWWFARNLSTYHRPLPPMTPLGSSGAHTVRSLHQLASWVSLTWKSTVGVEGPSQTPLVVGPGRVGLYLLAAAGVALAAVVLVAALDAIRSWRGHWERPAAWLLAAPPLTVGFSLINSITLDNQPQARYLLVAGTVWCGGVAWAVARLGGRRPRLLGALSVIAVGGMLVLDAATVQTLRLLS
jgi:hypothetical protein